MNKWITVRSNKLGISFLTERKTLWTIACLLVIGAAVMIGSAALGSLRIHPWSVIQVLFGFGEEGDALIVLQLRLPRIIVGFLVGVALASSGAILQGMIRNPLASPDIMGVTGGASVAAVLLLLVFPKVSIQWLPFAALFGASLITFIIYALAWKRGVTPMRLVLVGVGIGAAMSAFTTMLIVLSPIYLTAKSLIWMTGTVYGSNWGNVWTLLPWVLLFLPLAFVAGRSVNALHLGDDTATGVGSRVQRSRFLLLLICVALAGAGVAVGGAVGFVGLIAPHIARRLVGPSFGGMLAVSALVGGIIVTVADLIARTAFAPLDLPVGIFTSLIGAPFFIYLLYKHRNA